MHIVVTGGGGLGSAITRELRRRDHDVVVVDVDPARADVVGDVSRPGPWTSSLADAEVVVHTAAVVEESGDATHFWRVNVGGTRQVLTAAAAAGVRRAVHLSSIVVYGDRFPRGAVVGEDAPVRMTGAPYTDTKVASEHQALRIGMETALELVVVRPGDVYGPGSVPWTVRPVDLLRRGLLALPAGGRGILSPIHVDDLARGVAVAATNPDAAGRIYNLTGGEGVIAERFFRFYADHLGVPLRTLPTPVARALATLLQTGARLTGRPSPVAPEAMEYVSHPGTYSIARARDELGWTPEIGLAEGMRSTLEWVDAHLAA